MARPIISRGPDSTDRNYYSAVRDGVLGNNVFPAATGFEFYGYRSMCEPAFPNKLMATAHPLFAIGFFLYGVAFELPLGRRGPPHKRSVRTGAVNGRGRHHSGHRTFRQSIPRRVRSDHVALLIAKFPNYPMAEFLLCRMLPRRRICWQGPCIREPWFLSFERRFSRRDPAQGIWKRSTRPDRQSPPWLGPCWFFLADSESSREAKTT